MWDIWWRFCLCKIGCFVFVDVEYIAFFLFMLNVDLFMLDVVIVYVGCCYCLCWMLFLFMLDVVFVYVGCCYCLCWLLLLFMLDVVTVYVGCFYCLCWIPSVVYLGFLRFC